MCLTSVVVILPVGRKISFCWGDWPLMRHFSVGKQHIWQIQLYRQSTRLNGWQPGRKCWQVNSLHSFHIHMADWQGEITANFTTVSWQDRSCWSTSLLNPGGFVVTQLGYGVSGVLRLCSTCFCWMASLIIQGTTPWKLLGILWPIEHNCLLNEF